jgi:hypothetical protein
MGNLCTSQEASGIACIARGCRIRSEGHLLHNGGVKLGLKSEGDEERRVKNKVRTKHIPPTQFMSLLPWGNFSLLLTLSWE